MLEIGAGVGVLASLMVNQGVNYRGVEPSPFFYRQLLNNFPHLKNKVICGLDMDSYFKYNNFDLIVAVDVLQHIPYPVEFLIQLKKYLKKDGILYIELPSEFLLKLKAAGRRLLGLYFYSPVHPGHINFFTKKTFKIVLSNSGFKPHKLYQITLAGDHFRMAMTLKRKLSLLLRFFSAFIKFSKIDILLQQGNLVVVAMNDS